MASRLMAVVGSAGHRCHAAAVKAAVFIYKIFLKRYRRSYNLEYRAGLVCVGHCLVSPLTV